MSSDTLPPIIPREILFGNPEKASPQISPDGKLLAYLAPDEGVLNVWLKTAGQADDRVITRDRKRGIRAYFWAFDGRHLLYLQDFDGDENWHLWSVDLQANIIRDLTPFQGAQAQVVAVDPAFPNELLVSLNIRDARLHDVYRVNLTTGAVVMEAENPGDVVGWLADSQFQIRACQAARDDGGFELRVREAVDSRQSAVGSRQEAGGSRQEAVGSRQSAVGSRQEAVGRKQEAGNRDDGWRTLIVWGPDEEGGGYGFTKDGRQLYVGTTLGANTQELRLVNVSDGAEETVAGSPEVDLSEVLVHPTEHRMQAAGFNRDRLKWIVLDPEIQADMDFLQAQNAGEMHVVSRDLADGTWLILYHLDSKPAAYYRYDRKTRKLDFLFTTRPGLEKFTLAPMIPVDIKARDGLVLPCYLTVPSAVDGRWTMDDGGVANPKTPMDAESSIVHRPSSPLPMVLNVHGGPWARDNWGYDAEAQWLANRGYACLQVNFRGSTGFGKKFLHAGDREWGAKMHDDLIDSVNWAVEHGIADQKRVAIFGGSYGGYAALVGAAFTPDVFACAVDLVGPSSIITLINSIPPYWEPLKKIFTVRVGDPDTDKEFLLSRSPLTKVDQIKCPLLIGQGANDPRVKQAEAEQIVKAMRDRGKEVEYMVFEDEGHGFARPENRLKFYAAAEKFLAKHLGGRAE